MANYNINFSLVKWDTMKFMWFFPFLLLFSAFMLYFIFDKEIICNLIDIVEVNKKLPSKNSLIDGGLRILNNLIKNKGCVIK